MASADGSTLDRQNFDPSRYGITPSTLPNSQKDAAKAQQAKFGSDAIDQHQQAPAPGADVAGYGQFAALQLSQQALQPQQAAPGALLSLAEQQRVVEQVMARNIAMQTDDKRAKAKFTAKRNAADTEHAGPNGLKQGKQLANAGGGSAAG